MLNSWKTTIGGIITALALAWGQIEFIFDGDPLTNPDYNIIVAAIAALITGLSARDNDVNSEKAGAE